MVVLVHRHLTNITSGYQYNFHITKSHPNKSDRFVEVCRNIRIITRTVLVKDILELVNKDKYCAAIVLRV